MKSSIAAGVRGRRPNAWKTPARAAVLGFLVAGLVGTIVLTLPICAKSGHPTSLLDAGFTASSALAVTGLIVVDTETYWTGFGHLVILTLIQLGGFGVMTFGSLMASLLARRMKLRERINVASMTRFGSYTGLKTMLFGIARTTFIIEGVVWLVLTLRFVHHYKMGWASSSWHGLFYAVSSFNNAGFALRTDNLISYQGDPYVMLPICSAVILGGIGFPIFLELKKIYRMPAKWSVNTKMVLIGTGVLLAAGTLIFAVIEWSNPNTLGPMSAPEKIMNAFAQAVFPRTAGFNSIDIAQMHELSWFFTDILMFIGAGSGGTAGGVKITTIFVVWYMSLAEIRNHHEVSAFNRRLPRSVQREAATLLFFSAILVIIATAVLLIESDFSLAKCLYEVLSAFGTVGLSTGITANLGWISQVVLILLMYLGRLGPITMANALAHTRSVKFYDLPSERPLIG